MIRFVLAFILLASPVFACGPDSDCEIGDRIYRIRMPDGHDGKTPVGAIVYAHGYKGSAQGVMRNKGLAQMASELGVAFIAADAGANDWVIPGAPRKTTADGSREFTYFDDLIADVTRRFPIDPARLVASGFSAGGMMVWTLACHRGDRFAGFAPFSGTFWAPVPETCPSAPVSLIHTHGTADTVVPLSGRPIADTAQGDVDTAISMLAREGGFSEAVKTQEGNLTCAIRINPEGRILEQCLHPGGHAIEPSWLARAWRTLDTIRNP